jgi:hypothetical protein
VETLERDALQALGGAVVGVLLVWLWDAVKFRREARRRDRTSTAAILHSLDDNRVTCEENLAALRVETDYLNRDKTYAIPLLMLDDAIWQLLKLQLPRNIATDAQLLSGLSYVYRRIRSLNAHLASRDAFRQAHNGHPGFVKRLRKQDQKLVDDLESLWQVVVEYEHRLSARPSFGQRLAAFMRQLIDHPASR